MRSLGSAAFATLYCGVTLTFAGCTRPSVTAQSPAAARQVTLNDAETRRQSCEPLSARAGRNFGCFILASQAVGELGAGPAFWHLDWYSDHAAAEAARGP